MVYIANISDLLILIASAKLTQHLKFEINCWSVAIKFELDNYIVSQNKTTEQISNHSSISWLRSWKRVTGSDTDLLVFPPGSKFFTIFTISSVFVCNNNSKRFCID